MGYTWVNESAVSIRTLPGFIFNPSAVTSLIINDNNEEKEDHDQNKTMIEKKIRNYMC
jgi:hypothetical protein